MHPCSDGIKTVIAIVFVVVVLVVIVTVIVIVVVCVVKGAAAAGSGHTGQPGHQPSPGYRCPAAICPGESHVTQPCQQHASLFLRLHPFLFLVASKS